MLMLPVYVWLWQYCFSAKCTRQEGAMYVLRVIRIKGKMCLFVCTDDTL